MKEDIAAPQPAASEDEEEEEEEDEDDDDEEEDEDDEDSEEEAEVEKPTVASQGKRRAPSEDESSESEDDDGRTKEERLYDRAKRRIEVRDTAKSGGVTGSLSIPISDLRVLFVSLETPSGEHEEHRLGNAEGTSGVCARTRRHRQDQDPGQGDVYSLLTEFLPTVTDDTTFTYCCLFCCLRAAPTHPRSGWRGRRNHSADRRHKRPEGDHRGADKDG